MRPQVKRCKACRGKGFLLSQHENGTVRVLRCPDCNGKGLKHP